MTGRKEVRRSEGLAPDRRAGRASARRDPSIERDGGVTMTRLGRKPQGAALVMSLCGSEHAQRRMKIVLTDAGRSSAASSRPAPNWD